MPLASSGPKSCNIIAKIIAGIPKAAEKIKKVSKPILSAMIPVNPDRLLPTILNIALRKAY
jgi:hypothetical protein